MAKHSAGTREEWLAARIALLKDEKEPEAVKHAVAEGLSEMGPDAKEAVPTLRDLNGKAKKGDRTYQMAIQAITGRKK